MNTRPYFKSLRGKLTNASLIIGLVPVALVGAMAWYSLDQLTRSASEQVDNSSRELLDTVVGRNLSGTAARIAERLDTFMRERMSDVVAWASTPVVIDAARKAAETHRAAGLTELSINDVEARFSDRKSLDVSPQANSYLSRQIEGSTHFGEVFITDANGFNAALTGATSDFVQRDENWWKIAWENGISVGEVESDDSARIWSVDIAVRIDDPATGHSLGVMKAVLGVSLIQEVADEEARNIPQGTVTVVNSDGKLLAETASEHNRARIMADGVNLRKSEARQVQAVFAGPARGFELDDMAVLGFARSAGAELYSSVAARFPGFAWSVIVQQPRQVALAPVAGLAEVRAELERSRGRALMAFGVMVLAVVVLSLVIAGAISKRIVDPLLELRELADAVSKGDTSRTVDIASDDEIQDLAASFNRMNNAVAIIMQRYKDLKARSKQV